MVEKWYIREDGGAFDIMDETGAFCTCDDKDKAQLIVAAPDLFEACEAAIDTIEALYADILESAGKNCDIDSEMAYNTDETRQKLHKAIAEAGGGSNDTK